MIELDGDVRLLIVASPRFRLDDRGARPDRDRAQR
jgi:hypothetical protein